VSTTWSCSCCPCDAARLVKPLAKASAVSVDLMLVVCKKNNVSEVKQTNPSLKLSKPLERYLSTSESSNDIALAIWLDLPHVDP
jgi:hypothetical protein